MTGNFVSGMPGVNSGRSCSPRRVLMGGDGAVLLPAGRVIDGSLSRDVLGGGGAVLPAGLAVGRVSATGKYAPSVIAALSADCASEATTMNVSAVAAAEIVRRIGSSGTLRLTGPPAPGGQVASAQVAFSAVNVETGAVTITATGSVFIAGSFVGADDGSHRPVGLLADGYGLKVTDADGNDIDVPLGELLIGGLADVRQIVGYPTEAALQERLKSDLRASGYAWAFSDDF